MERTQRVVICGQSIFMVAIEAGLAGLPEVEVIRFDSRLPAVADRIAAVKPKLVLVERISGDGSVGSEMLQRGLPVIELDQHGAATKLFDQTVTGGDSLGTALSVSALVEKLAQPRRATDAPGRSTEP